MNRWYALIVDDEPMARDNLLQALSGRPGWLCVDACADAESARAAMARHPVDLVMLDVHMPRQSGLSFAAEISRMAQPPALVFVTAREEHALRAFEVSALDYLLKPFDAQRFAGMLARVERLLRQREGAGALAALQGRVDDEPAPGAEAEPGDLKHIHVRSVGLQEKVAVANITWVRTAGNYVELHLRDGVVLHRSSLDAIEKSLPSDQFIRVHRTALVRAALIDSLAVTGDRTYAASLLTGAQVPVSERFVADVRKVFCM